MKDYFRQLNEDEVKGVIAHELGAHQTQRLHRNDGSLRLPLIAYMIAQVTLCAGAFQRWKKKRQRQFRRSPDCNRHHLFCHLHHYLPNCHAT